MITLEDVAKSAGVSASTVSIVVNNRKVRGVSVSPATRDRVLNVAREMGYTPNGLARAMATGKNKVFGIIKDDFASEIATNIMVGAMEECDKLGYLLKPFKLPQPSESRIIAERCLGQRVAGLMLVNVPQDAAREIWEIALTAQVPVVMLDQVPTDDFGIRITSDDEMGIRLMLDFLIEEGHKRIAFMSGDHGYPLSDLRMDTFRTALTERGLPVFDSDILYGSWGLPDQVEVSVASLLNRPKENIPTALFCAGDGMAMMAIREARRLGFNVPYDLAVAGYSNADYAYLCDPALTTVSQDFVGMGRIAALHLLGSPSASEKALIRMPTRLVVRNSVYGGPFKTI
jgi:DNA-binding LacI/PurR family transcriptional regulator